MSLTDAIVEAVAAVPNVVVVTGTVSTLPVVRFTSDDAIVAASDLEALRRRTEPSKVGLEHANVLNSSLRRSRETSDVRLEPWPELDAILSHVAKQLHLNWSLSARVHKLVLYEAGSFFREHRDAEHCAGHMLSLVVDLGSNASGGVVSFGHERSTLAAGRVLSNVAPPPPRPTWHSRTGAWAAWFSSTRHAVSVVESGFRVVLSLDVVAAPLPTPPLFPAPLKLDGGVPPFAELVWQCIAELLPRTDRSRLARTCRGLYAMLGSAPALLATLLRSAVPMALDAAGHISVGFVCRNEYLFSKADTAETVPLWQLKGRDRIVAEAMRLCGWRVTVRRVRLLDEASELSSSDDGDAGGESGVSLDRVRIGCAEIERSSLDTLRDLIYRFDKVDETAVLLQALQTRVEHFDRISHTRQSLNEIRSTFHDNDTEDAFLVVPFVGVLWCESLSSLTAVPALQVDEQSGLWGNESMFGERTFAACAIIAHVRDADELALLKWSRDITHD